jgi:hypothetical protein
MAQRKWWRETQETTQPVEPVAETPQTTTQNTLQTNMTSEQQQAAQARRAVLRAAKDQLEEPLANPHPTPRPQPPVSVGVGQAQQIQQGTRQAQPKRILTQGTEETLNPATLDAWAEAEQEVIRRNASYAQGEVLEITANYLETRRRTATRATVLLAVLAIVVGVALAAPILAPLATMFALLLIGFLWLDLSSTRTLLKQPEPILTLSPEGITIHFPGYDLGLLRWEEIEEIAPYKVGWQCLGIRPKNPMGLVRKLGWKRAYAVWLNYGGPHKQPAIVIPEECLPLPVETIMKRIANYEQMHNSSASLASTPLSPNARPPRRGRK